MHLCECMFACVSVLVCGFICVVSISVFVCVLCVFVCVNECMWKRCENMWLPWPLHVEVSVAGSSPSRVEGMSVRDTDRQTGEWRPVEKLKSPVTCEPVREIFVL